MTWRITRKRSVWKRRNSSTRRDPTNLGRSLLELRRLAYKSKRNPSLLVVLHDALLETFPRAYDNAIREARRAAKDSGEDRYVVFRSSGFSRHPQAKRSSSDFFSIERAQAIPSGAVPVYEARAKKGDWLIAPESPVPGFALPQVPNSLLLWITSPKKPRPGESPYHSAFVRANGEVSYDDEPDHQLPASVKKRVERVGRRMWLRRFIADIRAAKV